MAQPTWVKIITNFTSSVHYFISHSHRRLLALQIGVNDQSVLSAGKHSASIISVILFI
jgi:hypothetical protein